MHELYIRDKRHGKGLNQERLNDALVKVKKETDHLSIVPGFRKLYYGIY